MKPPIPYFGSKSSIAERIVDLLPEHGHYVEPFAGSLSVLLAKPRSTMETVNDLDGDLITFWRVLRDDPEALARACALTPHSREEKRLATLDGDMTDLERARRVWVLLSQSRGGMMRNSGWRYCINRSGSSIGMPGYLDAYVSRMMPAAERLAGVSIECMDALDLIERYGAHEDVLLYVDPPYLGSTRTWGNNYRHEMRRDGDHRALADSLTKARSSVVLSGYPSPLYDDLYSGWSRVEISTSTGNGGDSRGRTEVLWSNRDIGHPVLDFEGLGA